MATPTARVDSETITESPPFASTSELYQFLDGVRGYQPSENSSTFEGVTIPTVTT